MDEGAIGLSTGLIYPPCCYGSTDELVWLCEEVARRDGVFVVHMRSESDRILTAVDEMIEVARRSRVHVHISHLKIAGRDNWPLAGELLGKLHAAREEGLRVTADQYPYGAGSTMFGAILPPWAHDGGVDKTVTRLGSPEERAKMRAQILESRALRLGQLLEVDRARRHRGERCPVGQAARADRQDRRRGRARRGKRAARIRLRSPRCASGWACR